ncbi:MAG: hypothetical protein GXO36_01860 [Chloroflexi bacterium]|nr:hypothetical protein [Chloroflexota bacterium]
MTSRGARARRRPRPDVALVGPCAAGKSTIARMLQARGWRARAIAQEHSFVPDMWRRLTDPRVLVFLDATWEETRRRKGLRWDRADYEAQQRRLAHARAHADLYIRTDGLSPEAVVARIEAFLRARGLRPAEGSV